ncbi:MAG: VWA domain-containing protein [Clostridiales bacterium]|nr:VWA domain-containing protein [Clostridiales bacterium]
MQEIYKYKQHNSLGGRFYKRTGSFLLIVLVVFVFAGCGISGQQKVESDSSFKGRGGGETIKILSGSENKELAQVLADCSKKTGVNIEMTYKGSVDIMNTLKEGAAEYDAVWPASSLWISLGDTQHVVKYDESISTSPVVFGIKESLAKQLNFDKGDVSVKDILEAIRSGKLTFCMTSATQSNSGASAYIGFLYALLDKQEPITEDDLENPELREDIKELLSGVDRNSGSSDWLKDMFLAGNYDAMVNYECLMIDTNKELEAQGKEPLYVVYPYDGLSIADSPLGYVDHGDDKKQDAFQKVQEYLLSEKAQNAIEKTGRRISVSGVSEENKDVFNADWGIDTERILSPITMPSENVLMRALNLYQTSFRKPSLTVYCLDYSGSMRGTGNDQLVSAMSQILIQENAEKNLLQAEQEEVNIIITFSSQVINVYSAENGTEEKLTSLYESVEAENPKGGTDIYVAVEKGLQILSENYDLENYTPAIILMTDGQSETFNKDQFTDFYSKVNLDIPIFSIMFGDATSEQLDELAKLSNARVFDGRTDLVSAFRSVKGYN